ncbi:MAG: FAD-dependent oxidoreductase, partial [Spirochaetia bacterium]|nr:FAD-dependent oxidoreductase [Spirochaetia bacterium]
MKSKLKIVIVGGVAGGAIAATRARRLNEDADITILERGNEISFANCGLPYFISRHIERREQLVLNTPESLWQRYRIKVEVNAEVFRIDKGKQRIHFKKNEAEHELTYDKLLLSQGARPSVPVIPGIETAAGFAFTLRSLADMDGIDSFIETQRPKTAVIVGGGFIGVEMAEAFVLRGIATKIIEYAPQIMPNLDPEFAQMARENLEAHGVLIRTGVSIKGIEASKKCQLSNGEWVHPDFILFAAGGRPETELAASAGLRIGETGGVE